MKTFYVGDENEKLTKSLRKNKISVRGSDRFYQKFWTADKNFAAVYIQKKHALNNPLLSSLSAIDSHLCQKSSTHKQLFNLKPYFESFLKDSLSKYGK